MAVLMDCVLDKTGTNAVLYLWIALGGLYNDGFVAADQFMDMVDRLSSRTVQKDFVAYLSLEEGDDFGDPNVQPPLPAWFSTSPLENDDDVGIARARRALLIGWFVPLVPPLHPARRLAGRVAEVLNPDRDSRLFAGVLVPHHRRNQYFTTDVNRCLGARKYKRDAYVLSRLERNQTPVVVVLRGGDATRLAELEAGAVVVVAFHSWPAGCAFPLGVVQWWLPVGPPSSARSLARALLAERGMASRLTFPPPVVANALRLEKEWTAGAGGLYDKEVEARAARGCDYRERLCCFTIDPPGSMDLDDACSIERVDDAMEVGVHIADPSVFVRPDTPLDAEARRRTSTVYLIGESLPMLPRSVSSGACSLLPDKDRLAISVFFRVKFDDAGRLSVLPGPQGRARIERSVICRCETCLQCSAWWGGRDDLVGDFVPCRAAKRGSRTRKHKA